MILQFDYRFMSMCWIGWVQVIFVASGIGGMETWCITLHLVLFGLTMQFGHGLACEIQGSCKSDLNLQQV